MDDGPNGEHDEDLDLVRRFKELYAQSLAETITGDPSLDLLLRVLEPAFATLVTRLALPHWFDQQLLSAVVPEDAEESPDEYFTHLTSLPFVRRHEHGHQYHDSVRAALRDQLLRQDPQLVRSISSRLASALAIPAADSTTGELYWERAYLWLAADEPRGLAELQTLFQTALDNRRYAACDTLVHMANEQRSLLSPTGCAIVDYERARLDFELRDWTDAEAHLAVIDLAALPPELRTDALIFCGRTLEAQGKWQAAMQKYQAIPSTDGRTAERWQRLASASLGEGRLADAESQAQTALSTALARGDKLVASRSLEILARSFVKLRDFQKAEESYLRSLALLEETQREFDTARIYLGLGDLFAARRDFERAHAQYEQAQRVKLAAGDNYGMATVYCKIGQLQVLSRETQLGVRYLREAAQLFLHFKDRRRSAEMFIQVGVAQEHAGDFGQAVESLRAARELLAVDDRLVADVNKNMRRLERLQRWLRRPPWQRVLIVISLWLLGLIALVVVSALMIFLLPRV